MKTINAANNNNITSKDNHFEYFKSQDRRWSESRKAWTSMTQL